MMTRQEKILSCIDPATQLGIEIGALNRPIVTREMGNIRYVDYTSTEELKQKYISDPNVDINQIVDVDYIWGEKCLPELVAHESPFDYVVAVHVIEHVPDLIGWLKEIHTTLKPGGILALAIPDKRYCFDYYRQLTGLPEVIEAYLQVNRKPTPRQIFDFFASHAYWKEKFIWSPQDVVNENEMVRLYSITDAWNKSRQVFFEQSYYDVHCWVFTPQSFLDLVKKLIEINLIDFQIASFYETEGCEFIVSLQALDLSKDPLDRQQLQLQSLPALIETTSQDEVGSPKNQQDGNTVGDNPHNENLLQNQEMQETIQRLRRKVKRLRSKLEASEREISAMKTSKFWRLREQWFEFKKMFSR